MADTQFRAAERGLAETQVTPFRVVALGILQILGYVSQVGFGVRSLGANVIEKPDADKIHVHVAVKSTILKEVGIGASQPLSHPRPPSQPNSPPHSSAASVLPLYASSGSISPDLSSPSPGFERPRTPRARLLGIYQNPRE